MTAGLVVSASSAAGTHLPWAKLSNSDQYGGGDLVGFLMFPESEHRPAGSAQLCRRISIPCDVSAQLLGPVRRVGPRDGPMLWAGMPVATIDEDGDALPGEDDVSGATEGWFWPMGDPETKAGSVQPPSNRQLGRSVPGPVSLHDLPGGGAACPAHVTLHRSIVAGLEVPTRPCHRDRHPALITPEVSKLRHMPFQRGAHSATRSRERSRPTCRGRPQCRRAARQLLGSSSS